MKKVGILCAIDPQTSQVAWNGSPIDAYIRFLRRADSSFVYAGYFVANGHFPSSPEDCDAYVITGSPQGVYDSHLWIGQLMDFIRQGVSAGKKFVGICFGHQVLAEALGGHVRKSEKGWGLGLRQFTLEKKPSWVENGVGECSLYFAHQDQVIELPEGAHRLGGNAFCPNAMFELDGLVLGIQGHPEFDTTIMRSIVDLAKENGNPAQQQVAEAAILAENDHAPEADLMARWIVDFISS